MQNKRYSIIIDSDIPFVQGVLEQNFNVVYLKGSEIKRDNLNGINALMIRTRTKCDSSLLEGSDVEAIFTATIGNDHIDLKYCESKDIKVYNAAGCNASGVVQYVLTSLFVTGRNKKRDVFKENLGIVGAGNVGERLAATASSLGIKVMRCDPPVKKLLEECPDYFSHKKMVERGVDPSLYPDRKTLAPLDYYSLEQIADNCSAISFHVPLTEETKGMFSANLIERIHKGTVLINSSRGEVINEFDVVKMRDKFGAIISDVWSGEPHINTDYLFATDIATPHIAGYSLEGKINATVYSVRNIAKYFKVDSLLNYSIEVPEIVYKSVTLDDSLEKYEKVSILMESLFPVMTEDKKLRDNPGGFEKIREDYKYRREFSGSFINKLLEIIN